MTAGCMDNTLHGLFTAIFGCNTLCAFLGMKVLGLLPISEDQSQRCSLWMIKMAWAASLLCSPWMKIRKEDFNKEAWQSMAKDEKLMSKQRPLFVMGNHTSFADVVFFAAITPTNVMMNVRSYMGSHLYKIPILCGVCKACGHFPVYFKSSEEGKFQVDAERMKSTEEKVSAFLKKGGWMCFYPEGQINSQPDTINTFRFGGIKQALEADAHIVFTVFVGNQKVWPKRATVGGYPGHVRHGVKDVTPDGLQAFLEELRKGDLSAEEKEMSDVQLLATRLRDIMQSFYDELKAKMVGPDKEHAN